jgi:hypothetical protein
MTNHRGHYLCRLDATAAAHGARKLPAARMIMASNAVDIPLEVGGSDAGVLTVQGQALLRTHPRLVGTMLGSGSVVAGYRRQLGDANSIDGSVQIGLNSLISATSTRQVDHYTQAALAATYNWEQGLGLQVRAWGRGYVIGVFYFLEGGHCNETAGNPIPTPSPASPKQIH